MDFFHLSQRLFSRSRDDRESSRQPGTACDERMRASPFSAQGEAIPWARASGQLFDSAAIMKPTTTLGLAALGAAVAIALYIRRRRRGSSFTQPKVFKDKVSLGAAAAAFVADKIKDIVNAKGNARVIFATGASQFEFVDALTKIKGLPWDKVECFHLDEYCGIPDTHGASFRKYLKERLFSKLSPQPKAVNLVDPDAVSAYSTAVRTRMPSIESRADARFCRRSAEAGARRTPAAGDADIPSVNRGCHVEICKTHRGGRPRGDVRTRRGARYSRKLMAGPVDLACIGIGENGHVAFDAARYNRPLVGPGLRNSPKRRRDVQEHARSARRTKQPRRPRDVWVPPRFNDPPVADFRDPNFVSVVKLDDACRKQPPRAVNVTHVRLRDCIRRGIERFSNEVDARRAQAAARRGLVPDARRRAALRRHAHGARHHALPHHLARRRRGTRPLVGPGLRNSPKLLRDVQAPRRLVTAQVRRARFSEGRGGEKRPQGPRHDGVPGLDPPDPSRLRFMVGR